jgi:hypothetical protein
MPDTITIIKPDYVFNKDVIIASGNYSAHNWYDVIIDNLHKEYVYAYESKTLASKKLNLELIHYNIKFNKESWPLTETNLKLALQTGNPINIVKNNLAVYKINYE